MGARRARSMARNSASGGSSRWASQPSPLMGDSAGGFARRRMRPRRRPSAMASSPPPSKEKRSLVKRGGHCAAGSRLPWATRRTPPPAGAWKPPVMPKWKRGQGRRSSSSQRCLPCRRTAVTRRPRSARAKRAGLTPSKTMESGAHCTDVIRRPRATRWISARAASTSGNSGTTRLPCRPALRLDDLEQLHLEDQSGAGLDRGGRTTIAVGNGGRTDEPALAADLHGLDPLRPAWDHLVQRKGRGLLPLHAAVEHGAVGEGAVIVHLHGVGGLGRGARSRLDGGDDETGGRANGALLRGRLFEIGLAHLLLRHGGRGEPRLLQLLHLGTVDLEVQVLLALHHAVRHARLDHRQLGLAQAERAQATADEKSQGIERLLLLGL